MKGRAVDPFDRAHAPVPGEVEVLAPGLSVVTAPNAGLMTFTGTRSFILGEAGVAVIDPGPDDPVHLAALERAVGGRRVDAILVTHGHLDHSAGAATLGRRLGAPVMGYGVPARNGGGGGEGIDPGYAPDETIGDGAELRGADWCLTALHTPGHLDDHLSFVWGAGDAVFSGDLVMGWATTVISPPEGNLAAFRASVARLQAQGGAVLYPGHGDVVTAPQEVMRYLLEHRQAREDQIRTELAAGGVVSVVDLVARIYAGVDPRLRGAAGRNVLAHLIDLEARGLARREGTGFASI